MLGILVINKSKGMTSHDVVYHLRNKLKIKKIGHTGTLDPMAEGVLPMCINKATKVASYISNDSKEYIAGLEFGYETDTQDSTGKILNKTQNIPRIEEIKKGLKEFQGKILQTPPMFSAIKINGQKLYNLARKGQVIERPKRQVEIYNLELIDEKNLKLKVSCSSGTYIRTLVHDIGISLNSFCVMTSLVRTRVGRFTINEAITLEELKNLSLEEINSKLYSMEEALYYLPKYNIKDSFYDKLLNGIKYYDENADSSMKRIYCKNQFIGIGNFIDGRLKIRILIWKF